MRDARSDAATGRGCGMPSACVRAPCCARSSSPLDFHESFLPSVFVGMEDIATHPSLRAGAAMPAVDALRGRAASLGRDRWAAASQLLKFSDLASRSGISLSPVEERASGWSMELARCLSLRHANAQLQPPCFVQEVAGVRRPLQISSTNFLPLLESHGEANSRHGEANSLCELAGRGITPQ